MNLIKNNILSESTEEANSKATHRSNVNEYLLAHELAVLAGHDKNRNNYNHKTGLSTTDSPVSDVIQYYCPTT